MPKKKFRLALLSAQLLLAGIGAAGAQGVFAADCPANWAEGAQYQVAQEVLYQGDIYRALVTHTAYPGAGWTPEVGSLWERVGPADCDDDSGGGDNGDGDSGGDDGDGGDHGGGEGPYNGAPIPIPGVLEAEHYDYGAFQDTTPTNEGGALRQDAVDIEPSTSNGYNIGWIEPGEWLEYSVNVSEGGVYTMSSLVAAESVEGRFAVSIDGARAVEVTAPVTGGWQNWTWVDAGIELSPGAHTLRVTMLQSGFNLNALQFTLGDGPGPDPDVSHLWAGANQYQLAHMSEADRRKQLQAMKDSGLKVLRVFVTRRGDAPWEIQPKGWTYEEPLGVYHDDQLEKMDKLMQECQEMGIKMVLALINFAYAQDSNSVYYNAFGPVGMYQQDAIDAYKKRFSHFLNHQNPYLGNKKWKDINDVVLAWEIANESGVSLADENLSNDQKYNIHRNFLTQMAAHLKAEDPDTYVALGIAGYDKYYNKGSADDIKTLGDIPAADIYTLHYYGGDLDQWLNDALPSVRQWGKLLFVEEFGKELKVGMETMTNEYRHVAETARRRGIPWMFWRMGLRKDENTWSVMNDDGVWRDVIDPESKRISEIETSDPWLR
ncbi:carbohydrate-binding protein [Hahella sp. CR1]|uniref:carbohydrate-binding protein n=1 Tax=Hahella sp. CR1 TaxID=2992807 RepID=UPI0024420178|nr:carbohydrate-binding protein [Hahella sp. CR1]MDG9670444.1 carbohydrate-binding protein [Hahella sp. CR1]